MRGKIVPALSVEVCGRSGCFTDCCMDASPEQSFWSEWLCLRSSAHSSVWGLQ